MNNRALICLCLIAPLALADSTLTYDEGGKQNRLRISSDKVRLDHHRNGTWFLFDALKNEMIVVDPGKKEFLVIDEAKVDSLRRSVDTMVSTVEAQIAKLPPSMREQARQMMGGVLTANHEKRSVRVDSTGQQGMAAGLGCEFKRFVINGRVESEVCLTAASNLGLPPQDLQAIVGWQRFARSLAEKASRYIDIDIRVFGSGDQIPLRYRYAGGSSEGVLTEIALAKLDPTLLQIPEGYRQREFDLPLR